MLASQEIHPAKVKLGMLLGLTPMVMLYATLSLFALLVRNKFQSWPPLGVNPIGAGHLLMALAAGLSALVFMRFSIGKQNVSYWRIAQGFALLSFAFLLWSGFCLLQQGLRIDSNAISALFILFVCLEAVFVLAALFAFVWVQKEESKIALSWYWSFVNAGGSLLFLCILFP